MWGQVLWEEGPAREGRPGWERPSAVWPQTKSFGFWIPAYFSVSENISAVVSAACPGLEDGNWGGCKHNMKL